ncbi:NADP-dependent glyceraldehyde-3-phosphate dehydrogenase [Clostridium senegalense]|uniref:NADP-dependent glyceraldehyde-3-phosphate dehydrogenase n=1 Tax=Clostridium senegalense TaxID=1465809 RepID=UPI001C0FE48B|nr:NADP-dependent glyceraldehyde-3-phosphate dehydrogenase [Clostridium senegalense]MBU5227373.1 NADP-dependent glyceraldehyde-3-phosphate dehydrogenase [Clostridium senegalense]
MINSIKKDNIYHNLYDGKWIICDNTIDIFSPTNGELIGKVPAMSNHDVDNFLENSKFSQKHWELTSIDSRADILYKTAKILEDNIDEISEILMLEIAKDKKSSISEVKRTADFIRYTADTGRNLYGEFIQSDSFPGFSRNKLCLTTRVPLGVVLAISPFNYPINLSASKIAPALMAGNSVLLKPPTQGSISALYLSKAFMMAGLPHGVLNTITGKSSSIGDYLVSHKNVNFINFTGSTKVGTHIASISNMVPLMMELGGKDAAIVLKDADIEKTAKEIISGAFSYSGQRCTAIKRVLVIEDIADNLVNALLNELKQLKVGLPEDSCDITPLIDSSSCDFVMNLIKDALDKGANLITGYKRSGNIVHPTLLDNISLDMDIAWEEPFGPVLPIIRVASKEEAISIANKSQYGLQSSIFTKNINDAFDIANKLDVGTVQINSKTERGPDHFPFSGVKSSGMGTQGIKYSIESMSRLKSIIINI